MQMNEIECGKAKNRLGFQRNVSRKVTKKTSGNKIKTVLQKYDVLLQTIPTRRYCGNPF